MGLSIDHAGAERRDLELEITFDHLEFIVAEVAEHLDEALPGLLEQLPELLHVADRDLDQHLAAVVRIPDAADETGVFEAVDHARDGTGGEPGELGEPV